MTFKVTTLLENSRIENEKLATEHGLSFFIEIGEPVQRRILFDTGQSGGFKEFVEANDERLDKTFAYLATLNLSMLGLSHCTGDYALSRLQQTDLPYSLNSTGTIICFEAKD